MVIPASLEIQDLRYEFERRYSFLYVKLRCIFLKTRWSNNAMLDVLRRYSSQSDYKMHNL